MMGQDSGELKTQMRATSRFIEQVAQTNTPEHAGEAIRNAECPVFWHRGLASPGKWLKQDSRTLPSFVASLHWLIALINSGSSINCSAFSLMVSFIAPKTLINFAVLRRTVLTD